MATITKECDRCFGDGHVMEDQIEGEAINPCITCNGYGRIELPILKVTQGDLLELFDKGEFNMIYPGGYNCFCTQGAGLAKKVADRWPAVRGADLSNGRRGDRTKMGTTIVAGVERTCGTTGFIMLGFSQYKYGSKEHFTDLVSYNALHEIFKVMCVNGHHNKVGIAKIGAGLGGGDWEVIQFILELEMKRYYERVGVLPDITLVEFA